MDIVIIRLSNSSAPIAFWSGFNWTTQYPDANQFPNPASAKRTAKMLTGKGNEGVMVMGDYGLDSETVLA